MRHQTIVLPAASRQLLNYGGCLSMFATRETTSTATAVFQLFDGTSTGGKLILPVSLDAFQSTGDGWSHCQLPFRQGLFYNLVSGAVEGAVGVLTHHDCDAYWAKLAAELGVGLQYAH